MKNPGLKFLLLRLACFLPLIGGLLLLDWISALPPVRRVVMRNLNAAAGALIAGRTVSGEDDPRDLKAAWLMSLPSPKDVLVLGSSRSTEVSEQWFRPRTMFNDAVFGADLDDAVGAFQFCLESGKLPRMVVMELNPSLSAEGPHRVVELMAPYFRRALLRYRLFPERSFAGLLSLAGVRWDMRTLLASPWSEASMSRRATYCIPPDGAIGWGVVYNTPDQAEAAALWNMRHLDALSLVKRTHSQPSPTDWKILRNLLDDMQSHGIAAVILLPPVHPAAYDFYYRQGGYHEDWIRREMAGRGIRVVGSFSPAITRATRDDFYDDVHPRPAILRRLLAEAGVVQP